MEDQITTEELQAKIAEVQENTRKSLEREYQTRMERELANVKKEASASSVAVYDQIAEVVGYDGKFSSPAEIAEFIASQKQSGEPVDVTKTKEYNALRSELQSTLKKAQEAEERAAKVAEEYSAKEKQRFVNDSITKAFSSISKDYVIPLDDAQALYLAKRQVEVGEEGVVPKDASGNPLFDPSGNIRSLQDDLKEVLRPYMKMSGGAGGSTSGNANAPKTRKDMTPSQKGEYIKKYGADAYAKLPI